MTDGRARIIGSERIAAMSPCTWRRSAWRVAAATRGQRTAIEGTAPSGERDELSSMRRCVTGSAASCCR
jgi:hypothetical protein